ncbi:MAG: hypothetical protein WCI77_08090 [Candidatus Omnitrophota bacterium]
MAATFPNAKKTFSAIINGVTKLVAALFNTPDDEIEAIESFVGATGGGALAYTESMTNMLFNYRQNCRIQYKSDSDLYVRAGEIMLTDSSGNRRLRRNTSDLTVNWANIDTGSEAANTYYYVYAVADASTTTFTVKISTNAATPSGCTFYKLIGIFYNDSSSNIQEVGNLNRNAGELDNWVSKSPGVAHYAMTDGVVVGYGGYNIYITTNGANPPTITRQYNEVDSPQKTTMTCPVRKGDYWSTNCNPVWWIGKS